MNEDHSSGYPFYSEITNVRPFLQLLRSFLVGKQHRFVTFCLDQEGPCRLLGESDDLSIQCSVEVPRQWFNVYSVTQRLTLTVAVNSLFNALTLYSKCRRLDENAGYRGREAHCHTTSCTASLLYPSSNALSVKVKVPYAVSVLEFLMYPRELSSIPLDLGFDRHLVAATFKGSLAVLRECILTLSSFGCDQLLIGWNEAKSVIVFEGIGSMYGAISCQISISHGTGNFFRKNEGYAFGSMKFAISSVVAVIGGLPGSPTPDSHDSPVEIQWNEAGMRIHLQWEHDKYVGVNATGEFVLIPFVM
ncbi:hypothetical protein XU18_0333 [Perkinsela sp. CCAP 1560/4]|nr:hypothetical protein XU18_0333 [Perkinsela sp. CCAP 1560/4]|eukprot:KNH09648.1 hypothetical protein XU18_0333 [Perkinsela sp. CCAP 1560/4]